MKTLTGVVASHGAGPGTQ